MNLLLQRLTTAKIPQALRALLLLFVYGALLLGSLWLSYQLRFEFSPPPDQIAEFARAATWLTLLELVTLWRVGQFRSLLSYFSVPDVVRIAGAQLGVCAAAFGVWYASSGTWAPPRSVLLINLLGGTAGLIMFRLALRLVRERYCQAAVRSAHERVRRIGIIGATDTGAHLVKEMKHRPDLRMQPVVIFDEDKRRWGQQIHGVPILGSYQLLLAPNNDLDVTEVIIAQTDIANVKLRQIVLELAAVEIRCKVAPPTDVLSPNGSYRQQIRPVEIQDLLGREPVDLQAEQIRDLIRNQCVAISGAGGSIGGELCRHVLKYQPRRLVLIEQCESQLFKIEQELLETYPHAALAPCVADVLDERRLQEIFRQHAPEIVFHAAAHKHVPMMEHQPAEAFQNNVIGTMRLADAAREGGCRRFVLISTDKAINPTSVMGATKRLAETYLQALQAREENATKFMAVRFGNVLGSSGSVIPTFKRQIAAGGPITVTDPGITRYFMVPQEAIGLVLQSATQGKGGEIFVLDMGTPVKIIDLANQMIALSGLRPGIDIEIKLTGLRPGEKLFEELNHSTENNTATQHPKIMRFVGRAARLESLAFRLQELHGLGHSLTETEMKLEIKKLVPEYEPYLSGAKEQMHVAGADSSPG